MSLPDLSEFFSFEPSKPARKAAPKASLKDRTLKEFRQQLANFRHDAYASDAARKNAWFKKREDGVINITIKAGNKKLLNPKGNPIFETTQKLLVPGCKTLETYMAQGGFDDQFAAIEKSYEDRIAKRQANKG